MIPARCTASLAVALALAAPGCSLFRDAALPTAADRDLAARLSSAADEDRRAAVAAAAEAGPGALAEVAPLLDAEDPGVALTARQALAAIAAAATEPGRSGERSALCRAAGTFLARVPPPSIAARAQVLQLLGVCADDEASLRLLGDWTAHAELAPAAAAALADTGAPHAVEILAERLATADEPAARAALLNALCQCDGPAAAAALLPLADGAGWEASAARRALARLGEPEAEAALRAALAAGAPAAAADLVRFAEARAAAGDAAAARALAVELLAGGSGAQVRAAAARCLAAADPGEVEVRALLDRLADDDAAVRAAAGSGLAALDDPAAARAIAERYAEPGSPARADLLRVLLTREPGAAVTRVAAALTDSDRAVRAAALEVAPDLAAPEIATRLDALAAAGDAGERDRALAALLAHGERAADAGRPELCLAAASRVLNSPDAGLTTRRAALQAIGRTRDPAGLVILDRVAAPELQASAGAARLALALELAGADPERAAAELERILAEPGDRARRARAAAALTRLGRDTSSFARQNGFLIDWHLLGPFPRATAADFATRPFDEAALEHLDREVAAGGTALRWREHRTADLDGIVNLNEALGASDAATAYATATFRAAGGPGFLRVGSDDGAAVWLNGALVLERDVMRGLAVDEDEVPVEFAAGENRVVIKVNQGGGSWSYCVRVAGAGGAPFDPSGQ